MYFRRLFFYKWFFSIVRGRGRYFLGDFRWVKCRYVMGLADGIEVIEFGFLRVGILWVVVLF